MAGKIRLNIASLIRKDQLPEDLNPESIPMWAMPLLVTEYRVIKAKVEDNATHFQAAIEAGLGSATALKATRQGQVAAVLRRPHVQAAIIKAKEEWQGDKNDDLTYGFFQLMSNIVKFKIGDFFTDRGSLKEGVSLSDIPAGVITGFKRKPLPAKLWDSKSGMDDNVLVEYQLASLERILELAGKTLGFTNSPNVSITNNNNTVNINKIEVVKNIISMKPSERDGRILDLLKKVMTVRETKMTDIPTEDDMVIKRLTKRQLWEVMRQMGNEETIDIIVNKNTALPFDGDNTEAESVLKPERVDKIINNN